MVLLSDYELLLYVRRFAGDNDVKVSPTECAFFVSLVHYIHENGSFDKDKGAFYIRLSCRELAFRMGYSVTLVFAALQKFDECGLIERVHSKKEFCPLGNGSFSYNKPSFTFVDLSCLSMAD